MQQLDGQDGTTGSSEKVSAEAVKVTEIQDACRKKDVRHLRTLAESQGGLLSDRFRRTAWPLLLGLLVSGSTDDDGKRGDSEVLDEKDDGTSTDWKSLPPHRDEAQVQLDVDRAFIYYPHHHNDEELRRNKAQLSSLITEVLRRYPYLCYFQGYHDICQVFLLVLDPAWRARTVARLSVLRIRDFMLPTLGPTTAQLQLLPEIIDKADPKLQQHLAAVQPFYALSSTLTMFAHNIEAYHDIARLFDVLIAREPVFSIYLFAQMIINRRDEVMEIDEPDMLHVILGKVPPNLNLDVLITDSVALHNRHPPSSLRSWRHMSNASVLKTVSNVEVCSGQTMEQGHEYFKQQVKEIQWFELQEKAKMLLWAYRKPAATMGLAVGVGLIGVYIQRNPSVLRSLLTLLKQR